MVHLQVKELESLKWTQFKVYLQEVGDKVILGYRVTVEACQPDKTKDLNARTATNTMLYL